MGVKDKRRSRFFLNTQKYFPENSLEALLEALKRFEKTDVCAVEFDIHVSKDGKAMVIHGNELRHYAKTLELLPNRVDPEFPLVEDYTERELQQNFALKDFSKKEEAVIKEIHRIKNETNRGC